VPRYLTVLAAGWLSLVPRICVAGEFRFADGDRVVLVGSTLIEREQRSGYWETALTRRYPGKDVTFRNLGWSGDTVFGHARAGFDTVADGFRRLKEQGLACRPTVIVVGYGANESFEGAAGVPHFVEGLHALLDALAPANARMVLLSPTPHEDLGPPLPDPAAHNRDLRLYRDAIRDVAGKRGAVFIDLFEPLGPGKKAPAPLTDNGIHLTADGYRRTARILEEGFGLPPVRWHVVIEGTKATAQGARVAKAGTLRFRVTDAVLPMPGSGERSLCVRGLAPGRYTLNIDGRPVASATATDWAAGVRLDRGPEFEQAECLRRAIVAKNELYFHRWRPQNETYLFGFRKHEQGQNAREVPEFDPLVAEQEAAIAKRCVPVAHEYELKRGEK
jgi:lysophospholipase L1-like esterase